jgi:hypothetical protein
LGNLCFAIGDTAERKVHPDETLSSCQFIVDAEWRSNYLLQKRSGLRETSGDNGNMCFRAVYSCDGTHTPCKTRGRASDGQVSIIGVSVTVKAGYVRGVQRQKLLQPEARPNPQEAPRKA